MSAPALPAKTAAALPAAVERTHGPARKISDVLVLAGRNLVHIAREPFQLSDVTIQPVLFTLMFIYVFGSGVVLPGGGSYKDFAVPGLVTTSRTRVMNRIKPATRRMLPAEVVRTERMSRHLLMLACPR